MSLCRCPVTVLFLLAAAHCGSGYSTIPNGDASVGVDAATSDRGPSRTVDGSMVVQDATIQDEQNRSQNDAPAPEPVQVPLPPADEWTGPVGSRVAPGDRFDAKFTGQTANGAPIISGWNDSVLPGEALTLTGAMFTVHSGTAALSDTKLWLWAGGLPAPRELAVEAAQAFASRSTDLAVTKDANDALAVGRLAVSSDQVLHARIPNDLPIGMYLLWVENAKGVSTPAPVNRSKPQWLGPLGSTAAPGSKMRIFGKNLSQAHGTTTSYVFFRAAGQSTTVAATVTRVEPYAVEFTVPEASGTYDVFLHNGHGGTYGWGGALSLTVAVPWQRAILEIRVPPSGSDDTAAIQSAIDATSSSTGGTVRLAAGTFRITDQLQLLPGVRLVGAGKDATHLNVDLSREADACISIKGDHSALEDFELFVANASQQARYGMLKTPFPNPYSNVLISGMRFHRDTTHTSASFNFAPTSSFDFAVSAEVRHSEFDEMLSFGGGQNCWVHDNVFHGGPLGPSQGNGGTEAAVYADGNNFVLEHNSVTTPAWPTGPGGSRNYLDFKTEADLQNLIWARRLFYQYVHYRSPNHGYYAWNTATDVGVEDNKGELFLFHGGPSGWYAQLASVADRMVTIRSDGMVMGSGTQNGQSPAKSVPVAVGVGAPVDSDGYLVVIAGPGLGQARRITSHTASTMTIDAPWRVMPTSMSIVSLVALRTNQIVYHNDLRAFPAGFVWKADTYSASGGVQFDENAWDCVAEQNTSRGTYIARGIGGEDTAPSYWDIMRNEVANAPANAPGYYLWSWGYANARVGYDLVGSRFTGEVLQP